jgi:membrane fusion protein (multidrug efflux system)
MTLAVCVGWLYASPQMRYLVVTLALILVLGGLAGIKGAQIATLIGFGQQMQKLGPPPESVNSARAEQQEWEQTLTAIATVVSGKGVALSNDAAGVVSKLSFESGTKVKAGQVLMELDASVERAQAESLRARLKLAAKSLERTQALRPSGVATESDLDTQSSAVNGLVADLKALQAQIERKTVRAPFAGKLGIRAVNLGQYLPPGTTVAVLESTDSVFVDFALPQQDLSKIKIGQPVRLKPVSSGETPIRGTISAFEPSVDAVTRNVKVRASFPDDQARLTPGMFVNIEIILPQQSRVTAVPLTSVVHAPYGDSVFIVEPKEQAPPGKTEEPEGAGAAAPSPLLARQQFVRLGPTRGDFVAVVSGVTPGQEVVSSGAFKLRNGVPIAVKNEVQAAPELSPNPENR